MATATKQRWCDMPLELLSLVLEHLDLIGRLRFRAVCKDFLRAASYYNTSSNYQECFYYNPSTAKAIAQNESIPWFLEYGDRYCTLLSSSNERHTNVSFKDLQGATVLASSEGWLLVFKQGSVFFLCPFSGAKIDLPNLPYSQLTDHVAAFTPPTLTYSSVAIISRSADDYVDLNEIDRFSRQWTTEKLYIRREVIDTIKAAIYFYGAFYFLAEPSKLRGGLEVKVNSLEFRPIEPTSAKVIAFEIIKYYYVAGRELPKGPLGIQECINSEKSKRGFCDQWYEPAKVLGIKDMLCLDDDVELSTCGTFVIETLFFNEIIKSTSHHVNGDSNIRRVKGVWIHPRFHEITAHDAWLII